MPLLASERDSPLCMQITLQDMPNVPEPLQSEEIEEDLELPDVPTKVPVAPKMVKENVEVASSEISTKRKGLSLSLPLCVCLWVRIATRAGSSWRSTHLQLNLPQFEDFQPKLGLSRVWLG